MGVAFCIIVFVFALYTFGSKYVLVKGILEKHFFSFKTRRIELHEVATVQFVTVKRIGTIYLYIGKIANQTKEDGYYLLLKNGVKFKVSSQYRKRRALRWAGTCWRNAK